jgi:hypothetical protein
VQIVDELGGKPPSWPGFAPPDPCEGGGVAEASSSRMQCVDTGDCPDGEVCSSFQCVKKAASSSDDERLEGRSRRGERERRRRSPTARPKRARTGSVVWFAPDLAMIQGTEVCSTAGQTNEKYVCLRGDESRYAGVPDPRPRQQRELRLRPRDDARRSRLRARDHRRASRSVRASATRSGGTSAGGASFHARCTPRGVSATRSAATPSPARACAPGSSSPVALAQVDVPVEVQVVEDGVACGADDPSNFSSACTGADLDRDRRARAAHPDAHRR